MSRLTLDDLSARYDPKYVVQETSIVYGRALRPATSFIIVGAQNATPVEPNFWNTLLKIRELTNAELLVPPIRYCNPTSIWSGSKRNEDYYVDEVRPYLWNQRHALNSNLTFLADIRIVPTATDPLSGTESLGDGSSLILVHPRVQTKSVATPANKMAKMLWTTGVCTVSNYADCRKGRLADDHHSLSALMVELVDGKFFIRRLHWDSERHSIIDLDKEYTVEGAQPAPSPLALIMGDAHVDFFDLGVHEATFGPNGLVPALRPQHLVFHDLLDAYSINPHHRGNPFNAIAKHFSMMDDAAGETRRAIAFVKENTPEGIVPVVVSSNHDDMLSRWVKTADWKTDPRNAEFYLETALEMTRSTRMDASGTSHKSAFSLHLEKSEIPLLKILGGGESFFLGNHELGFHGDRGPNGARGSIRNMARLGNKVVIGHSHSPGEFENAIQVGTSSRLLLEYNAASPSSWLNAHVVLHVNHFTQLIVIIDGQYRK